MESLQASLKNRDDLTPEEQAYNAKCFSLAKEAFKELNLLHRSLESTYAVENQWEEAIYPLTESTSTPLFPGESLLMAPFIKQGIDAAGITQKHIDKLPPDSAARDALEKVRDELKDQFLEEVKNWSEGVVTTIQEETQFLSEELENAHVEEQEAKTEEEKALKQAYRKEVLQQLAALRDQQNTLESTLRQLSQRKTKEVPGLQTALRKTANAIQDKTNALDQILAQEPNLDSLPSLTYGSEAWQDLVQKRSVRALSFFTRMARMLTFSPETWSDSKKAFVEKLLIGMQLTQHVIGLQTQINQTKAWRQKVDRQFIEEIKGKFREFAPEDLKTNASKSAKILGSLLSDKYRDLYNDPERVMNTFCKKDPFLRAALTDILNRFDRTKPSNDQILKEQDAFEMSRFAAFYADHKASQANESSSLSFNDWLIFFTQPESMAEAETPLEQHEVPSPLDNYAVANTSATRPLPFISKVIGSVGKALSIAKEADQSPSLPAFISVQAAQGEHQLNAALKSLAQQQMEIAQEPQSIDKELSREITLLQREVLKTLKNKPEDTCALSDYAIWEQEVSDKCYAVGLLKERMQVDLKATSPAKKHLQTDLQNALDQHNFEDIRQLIEAGADPNLKDKEANPLLHLALKEDAETALLAIKAGADPNIQDAEGNTALSIALSLASDENKEEIIRELLDAGANPNDTTPSGIPLLHKAVLEYNNKIALLFLNAGADPNVKDKKGKTPLSIAIKIWYPNDEVIQELLKTVDPNGYAPNGMPYLHFTILEKTSAVPFLLQAGADPNIKDKEGNPPLLIALKNRLHAESVISELLEAGADPQAAIQNGVPFLHQVILLNMLDAVEDLIERDVDVNAADIHGNLPLFYAKEEPIALALLDADADTTNPDGSPILNLAVIEKKWGLAKAILTKKTFVKHLTSRELEKTIVDAPITFTKILIPHLNKADYPEIFNLPTIMRLGRLELFPFLDQNPDVNMADQNGMTALHWAYLLNLPNVPQFLLERGANVNAVNRFGLKPADYISEKTLRDQVEEASQQVISASLPPKVLAKLKGTTINKGVSKTYAVHALSLIPTPLNASMLDVDIIDLVKPFALCKLESLKAIRSSIPLRTGALRQLLGALTGRYLDELLIKYPITDMQGFYVPETFIERDPSSSSTSPMSITRFVPGSVDMHDTTSENISSEEWTKLFVLDLVLGNTDRHPGNYRIQTTLNKLGAPIKKIIPIDHDLTLPNLQKFEYEWTYLWKVSSKPFSEEWKNFILNIDADALWKQYESEAAIYTASFANYTKGESGINDDVYLNFQARIKILQEGVKRGWPPTKIGKIFSAPQRECALFFIGYGFSDTREGDQAYIFQNIVNYFNDKESEETQ